MTALAPTTSRGARVVPVPPPAYYAAPLALGTLAGRALGLGWADAGLTAPVGSVLLVAGVALAASGVVAVVRHRTTIVPHRPVRTLLTGGAYRLSRNPMYAGLAVAYLGAALLLRAPVAVATLPFVLLAVQRLVIRPEEDYLAAAFPDAYASYRARVRRWL